ncbi:PREDICTED: transcription factor bHLH18-like [Ipomoea nil]|uniref:transcription factor bHLH18-like n=1 Tax=Ipomoea nil TaxID=35883 RepID=UPI0009010F82|nr:PREDICTED: transcription factor bHLH18-like [Ipomoea nil]
MEIANMRSLAELGMEDSAYLQHWPICSLDELSAIPVSATFSDTLNPPFSQLHHHHHHQPIYGVKRPLELSQACEEDAAMKHPRTNSWSSSENDHAFSSQSVHQSFHVVNSDYSNQIRTRRPKEETISHPSAITFHADHHHILSQDPFVNQNFVFKAGQEAKKISNTAQDHIIAERKRREKLSQRFIALSALVPGLKKMDKASVLGDAIKHLKQLQERVKMLEEQTRKKSAHQSVVFVKKYEVLADAENSSSDENLSGVDEPLPEIEVRISDKDVLVRVHCEKSKGVVDKTVAELENLHLSVTNSTAMSFGNSALDITIIAQMDEKFPMTVKDIVMNLRSALKIQSV